MAMEEHFVPWTERKSKTFSESEPKHLVRSPHKNSENTIFLTRDKGRSILGEKNIKRNCNLSK